jgi:hypothetical protein
MMKVYSPVVSHVVPVGFADLAHSAEQLPGRDFVGDRARLKVHGLVGTGLAEAVRYGGTLRTTAVLPPIKVEVVVSPWSAGQSEIAIHPITELGQVDSLRANRFFKAAGAILPLVIDQLNAELSRDAPAALQLAA